MLVTGKQWICWFVLKFSALSIAATRRYQKGCDYRIVQRDAAMLAPAMTPRSPLPPSPVSAADNIQHKNVHRVIFFFLLLLLVY